MGRSGQVSTGGGEPVTESLQETAMNQNTSTAKHIAYAKHKQIPNIKIQTQKRCLALDCYGSKQRLSQEPSTPIRKAKHQRKLAKQQNRHKLIFTLIAWERLG